MECTGGYRGDVLSDRWSDGLKTTVSIEVTGVGEPGNPEEADICLKELLMAVPPTPGPLHGSTCGLCGEILECRVTQTTS